MIKNLRRTKIVLGIISALLVIVLLTLSIMSTVSANRALQAFRLQAQEEERQKASDAEARIKAAEKEAEELRERLADIAAELAFLKANDRHQYLTEQIAELELELETAIAEYEEQLDVLDALIRDYQTVYTIDVIEQGKIINQLLELLSDGAPQRKALVEEDEEEEPDPDSPPPEPEYFDAKVALFYQDLSTGYTFAYNEDEVFYSASLIKLTYIWSLLKRISHEEDLAAERAAECKEAELERMAEEEEPEENPEEREWPEYIFVDPKYDLSETIILDKEEMMREGSGVIKDMEDGTEFTYRELIEYALRKSDNIAFALLCERFGFGDYYQDALAIGVMSVRQSYYRMTAKEGGLFLKAIYDFIETDERYGAFLRECMIGSAHTVMIVHGVYPTVTAHKYGWDIDAYHDMGIVYNKKPYVLIFMSDLDEGSYNKEVNTYVRQVISLVNKLHNNYYKKS